MSGSVFLIGQIHRNNSPIRWKSRVFSGVSPPRNLLGPVLSELHDKYGSSFTCITACFRLFAYPTMLIWKVFSCYDALSLTRLQCTWVHMGFRSTYPGDPTWDERSPVIPRRLYKTAKPLPPTSVGKHCACHPCWLQQDDLHGCFWEHNHENLLADC